MTRLTREDRAHLETFRREILKTEQEQSQRNIGVRREFNSVRYLLQGGEEGGVRATLRDIGDKKQPTLDRRTPKDGEGCTPHMESFRDFCKDNFVKAGDPPDQEGKLPPSFREKQNQVDIPCYVIVSHSHFIKDEVIQKAGYTMTDKINNNQIVKCTYDKDFSVCQEPIIMEPFAQMRGRKPSISNSNNSAPNPNPKLESPNPSYIIYWIRHGQSCANIMETGFSQLFKGLNTPDPHLSPTGMRVSKEIGDFRTKSRSKDTLCNICTTTNNCLDVYNNSKSPQTSSNPRQKALHDWVQGVDVTWTRSNFTLYISASKAAMWDQFEHDFENSQEVFDVELFMQDGKGKSKKQVKVPFHYLELPDKTKETVKTKMWSDANLVQVIVKRDHIEDVSKLLCSTDTQEVLDSILDSILVKQVEHVYASYMRRATETALWMFPEAKNVTQLPYISEKGFGVDNKCIDSIPWYFSYLYFQKNHYHLIGPPSNKTDKVEYPRCKRILRQVYYLYKGKFKIEYVTKVPEKGDTYTFEHYISTINCTVTEVTKEDGRIYVHLKEA